MDVKLFEQLLGASVQAGTSDIHIKAGSPLMIRDQGEIVPVMDERLSLKDVELIVSRLLERAATSPGSQVNLDKLSEIRDYDCSYSLGGVGRFRVNVYRQRGSLAVTMRIIPSKIPTIKDLLLPEVLNEIAVEPRGMVLVTGTTGSGKSTTMAAMLNHVNMTRTRKIITVEDPIEFLIPDGSSFLSQREVGGDTESFAKALRAALRQDPDVIMLGEMRDRETIEIALKAAETGHAVISTLHTADAEGTISRLVGAFDLSQQEAVRLRLSDSIKAIVSQRLLPRKDGDGRIGAVEIMRMTTTIRERIISGDNRGFNEFIEKGWNPYQMQTFDQHMIKLIHNDLITEQTGLAAASSPTNFKRALKYE